LTFNPLHTNAFLTVRMFRAVPHNLVTTCVTAIVFSGEVFPTGGGAFESSAPLFTQYTGTGGFLFPPGQRGAAFQKPVFFRSHTPRGSGTTVSPPKSVWQVLSFLLEMAPLPVSELSAPPVRPRKKKLFAFHNGLAGFYGPRLENFYSFALR